MQCEVRIRLKDDAGQAFVGIGSVWLLENIQSCGSVRAAAESMDLSYPKALKIIKSLEENLGYPVVNRTKGGNNHGGAELTPEGLLFLEEFRKLYNELQQEADKRAKTFWQMVKKTKQIMAIIMACLLGSGLNGCTKTADVPRTAARQEQTATVTVTDAAGRRVAVPQNVQKIGAAGPAAAILIYALAPERLAGWAAPLDKETLSYFPENIQKLPVLGRLSGRGGTASYEQFIKNRVDLLVDFGDLGGTYISLANRVQEQTGIPYLLLDGNLDKTAESLQILAKALDMEAAAAPLVARTAELLRQAQAAREVLRQRQLKIYLARGGDGLESAGSGDIHAQAMDLLGLENVVKLPGSHGLVKFSLEDLYAAQPDYILTNDLKLFAYLQKAPAFQGLAAVKNGHLLALPQWPLGWLSDPPSINRILGLPWLLLMTGQLDFKTAAGWVTTIHQDYFHCPVPPEALELLRKVAPNAQNN